MFLIVCGFHTCENFKEIIFGYWKPQNYTIRKAISQNWVTILEHFVGEIKENCTLIVQKQYFVDHKECYNCSLTYFAMHSLLNR